MVDLSICISCYSPSKVTIENILIIQQELNKNKNVELVYFDNGSEKNKPYLQVENLLTKAKLCAENQIIFFKSEKNFGVGGGYSRSIKMAKGKYILLLGDDDMPDTGYIKNLLSYLEKNNVDFCHQYLLNTPQNDSLFNSWTLTANSPFFAIGQAELAFRSSALPGCVFKKSLFEKNPNWDEYLYPWIQLVFDNSVQTIAVLNLKKYIHVDPGPEAHLRFSDRIPRGSDYAIIERLSYVKNQRSRIVRLLYTYKCLRWIQDVYTKVYSENKTLAKDMKRTLEEAINFKVMDEFSPSGNIALHCVKSSSKNIIDISYLFFSLFVLLLFRKRVHVNK